MTLHEFYGLAGAALTIWLLVMAWVMAWLASNGWQWGQFHAVDRINKILDDREELEERQKIIEFPKRTE